MSLKGGPKIIREKTFTFEKYIHAPKGGPKEG